MVIQNREKNNTKILIPAYFLYLCRNVRQLLDVIVNFMCRLDWAKGYPDTAD